jgi:cardiolipin synthase A/B
VRDALIAARARGVRVRLMIDGFGSGTDGDSDFLAPLTAGGVELCVFMPRWGRRYLLRNHQKMAIADADAPGAAALLGGFNIADAYFDDDGVEAWRDLGLTASGPIAAQLARYFDALWAWSHQRRARLRTLRRTLVKWSVTDGPVRLLHGGPVRRISPWTRQLKADLKGARDLSIVAAYFAPTRRLTTLIDRISRRGRTRIVTAGRTDNPATIGAARFTYPGLLRKGERIFEYRPHRLHSKLYVIDDVVMLGSANFDPRSLYLNLEVMVRIDDRRFADACRAHVEHEIADSRERTLDEFSGLASIPARIQNAVCWFLVAVLDPVVTARLNVKVD